MEKQGRGARRRGLGLEGRTAPPRIPGRKRGQGGQRPQWPNGLWHRRRDLRSAVGDCPASGLDRREDSPGRSDSRVLAIDIEQARAKLEEMNSTFNRACRVRRNLQPDRPPGCQDRKLGSADSARQKLGHGRLQSRFSRDLALVQLFEPLAPPGELDRPQGGFRRTRDDVRQCVVDVEQGVECRSQLRRPMQPHEVAIATRRVSDR
jgi:hypothetical protein